MSTYNTQSARSEFLKDWNTPYSGGTTFFDKWQNFLTWANSFYSLGNSIERLLNDTDFFISAYINWCEQGAPSSYSPTQTPVINPTYPTVSPISTNPVGFMTGLYGNKLQRYHFISWSGYMDYKFGFAGWERWLTPLGKQKLAQIQMEAELEPYQAGNLLSTLTAYLPALLLSGNNSNNGMNNILMLMLLPNLLKGNTTTTQTGVLI